MVSPLCRLTPGRALLPATAVADPQPPVGHGRLLAPDAVPLPRDRGRAALRPCDPVWRWSRRAARRRARFPFCRGAPSMPRAVARVGVRGKPQGDAHPRRRYAGPVPLAAGGDDPESSIAPGHRFLVRTAGLPNRASPVSSHATVQPAEGRPARPCILSRARRAVSRDGRGPRVCGDRAPPAPGERLPTPPTTGEELVPFYLVPPSCGERHALHVRASK